MTSNFNGIKEMVTGIAFANSNTNILVSIILQGLYSMIFFQLRSTKNTVWGMNVTTVSIGLILI